MLHQQLEQKINLKTKPLGALGVLEQLALQIGLIQKTLTPKLNNPHLIVFAGDHGIARHGVSAYPPEVTPQMVLNFLNGGAAINVFCRQHNIQLKIVDAGVNFDFETHPDLIDAKIAKGTMNFLEAQAMTELQLQQCFDQSADIVRNIAQKDCNIIGLGEMGIGNTSSASLIMSSLCNLPIQDCVGRGTGLESVQITKKIEILEQAKQYHGTLTDPLQVLQTFGGYEVAQMCGAMLEAFRQNMIILIDGFIASSAFLVASSLQPEILNHAVFCHLSDENGHQHLLKYLKATPLLQLNMRVGEGTGCAVAYPILQSAVNFLNEMASFESAGVSNKD